jgi:hypothetical protein
MRLRLICLALLFAMFGAASSASALVILGQLNSSVGGPDNSAANGGGNIAALFEAAAGEWEAVLLDDRTLTIPFGWVSGSDPLGFTDGVEIYIPAGNPWFLDPTPSASEEYASSQLSTANIGGTSLNYSITRGGAVGAATGFDLFSVLLHEIGHILSFGVDAFADYADGDVDITAPLPLAGLSLPTFNGGCCHLGTPAGYVGDSPLMFPFFDQGERRFISDADLLFVAQTGDFEQLAPDRLRAIPEPAIVTFFAMAVAAASLHRRRGGIRQGRRRSY